MRILLALLLCLPLTAWAQRTSPSGPGRGQTTFSPPIPPPYTYDPVATYAALRAIDCAAEETANLTAAIYGGVFECTTNPDHATDDGGIVIDDASGAEWWQRSFARTEGDPIQLDWYDSGTGSTSAPYVIDQNTDVTNLMAALVGWYTGTLPIKTPTTASAIDTLQISRVDLSTVNSFYLLESDKAATLTSNQPIVYSSVSRYEMFRFDDPNIFKMGGDNLNLTLLGQSPQTNLPDSLVASASGKQTNGLINILSTNGGTLVDIRANISHALGSGINIEGATYGSVNQITSVNLAGTFTEASPRINSGVKHLWFDSTKTVVRDPLGHGNGWGGGPGANYCAGYPTNPIVTLCFHKNRNVYFQNFTTLTGGYTQQYGQSNWFGSGVGTIGTSTSDRFWIRYDSVGYLGPEAGVDEGTALASPGFSGNGGKFDGADVTGKTAFAYGRFMRFTNNTPGIWSSEQFLMVQASRNGPSGECSGTAHIGGSYFDFLIEHGDTENSAREFANQPEGSDECNQVGGGSDSGSPPRDSIYAIHWRGDDALAMNQGAWFLNRSDSLTDGHWEEVHVSVLDDDTYDVDNNTGELITNTYSSSGRLYAYDVHISSATIEDSLVVEYDARNITLDAVAFSTGAGIYFDDLDKAHAVGADVTATNMPTPPSGVTIASQDWAKTTFTWNTKSITADCTWDGSGADPDTDCL